VSDQVQRLLLAGFGFALFSSVGLLCTFYPRSVQRFMGSKLAMRWNSLLRWAPYQDYIQSRFHRLMLRLAGVGSLLAAIVLFYGIVRLGLELLR